MTEFRLLQIREALEKTLRKLLEDVKKQPLLSKDFEKVSILIQRLTELCEGNQELAFKLIEYVMKKIEIDSTGEFQYMLNEILARTDMQSE